MPFNIGGEIFNSYHADLQDYRNIITRGLVLHLDASTMESYPQSGNTWFDISSTNTSANMQGSPSFNSDNGGSIVLNGSSQYIDVGSFINYSQFTILLWVNPGSTQVQYADIFDNNHTGTQNFVCQQNSTNTNQYEFVMLGTSTFSTTGLFTLTANNWVFLSFTFDGSITRGYKNASLIGTGNSMTPNYVSPYFRLGNWAGGNRHWNGKYGNCLIYNRQLSADEITQTYNVQKARFGL